MIINNHTQDFRMVRFLALNYCTLEMFSVHIETVVQAQTSNNLQWVSYERTYRSAYEVEVLSLEVITSKKIHRSQQDQNQRYQPCNNLIIAV